MKEQKLVDIWYGDSLLKYALLPLSLLYISLDAINRLLHSAKQPNCTIPVIVVGNITVGGTGKSPFVIWLVGFLRKAGFTPGVISRGYGSDSSNGPTLIKDRGNAYTDGDEAVMIAEKANIPVCVSKHRVAALQYLLHHEKSIDIVISDDGLQHYPLFRDIEIVLVDQQRQFGNGQRLPAGPLRSSPARLESVDFIVYTNIGDDEESLVNKFYTQTEHDLLHAVDNDQHTTSLQTFNHKTVHAIAGIAHPSKFYALLEASNINVIKHEFSDHHRYTAKDFESLTDFPILMTEKDAIKCRELSISNAWCLPINFVPNETFVNALSQRIENL